MDEWKDRDALCGSTISLNAFGKVKKGICRGINDQGHLLLEQSDGVIQAYATGDAAIVK